MRRLDLAVAVLVVGLSTWAVVGQLTDGVPTGGPPDRAPALALGEAVDPDVVLRDLAGTRRRLGDFLGAKATVLYAWSTTCPCIPYCEDELKVLVGRYPGDAGVSWVGVAGEPTDTPEGVARAMRELGASYPMLLDPSHRVCGPVGFDRAAMVAVLDADGHLRFRGNLTDALKDPVHHYLADALAAVVAGRRPERPETPDAYGCEFSAPVACEDEETAARP